MTHQRAIPPDHPAPTAGFPEPLTRFTEPAGDPRLYGEIPPDHPTPAADFTVPLA